MDEVLFLSLKLFNSIPKGKTGKPCIKEGLRYGVVIDANASYAQQQVLRYFKQNTLEGKQLNATFHKSWKVIRDHDREELFLHQILHYMTTYGTHFTSDFIYIPAEPLKIPKTKKIPLLVIRGLEKSELIQKALDLLSTGVALEESTLDDILMFLSLLEYKFESLDFIKNKEALVKIIFETGVYPKSPTEFLRFLVYLATDSTLLIKNKETIERIQTITLDISKDLHSFGLEKCATIFNRFKPIWLAFKSNPKNVPAINKISKLSKVYHQPLPKDILNHVTSGQYSVLEVEKALESVNVFRKIRLLNALNTRLNLASSYLYRTRNGKAYAKEVDSKDRLKYYQELYDLLYGQLKLHLDVIGKRIKYPELVDYAMPSSEKMFVGNVPVGTRITAPKLVSGIYWKNEWGARDLDLSALPIGGKVGWNSAYAAKGLMYSGDVTNAPNGACELLFTKKQLPNPALSMVNIYNGEVGCSFKLVIGSASDISKNYMFHPKEKIMELETTMKARQQILGLYLPSMGKSLTLILVNAAFGNFSVSGNRNHSIHARQALYYQYSKPISLKQLLIDAGAKLTLEEDCDLNLCPTSLQKDTLINLFS